MIRRCSHAGRRRLSAAPDEHQVRGSKLRDGDELRAGQAAARQNVLAASRRSASSRARSLPTPHRQSVSRSGRLLPSPIRPGSFWRSTVTIFHSTDASHAEVSIRVQGSMQEARPDEQKGSGSRSCNPRRSAPWQQGLISKH